MGEGTAGSFGEAARRGEAVRAAEVECVNGTDICIITLLPRPPASVNIHSFIHYTLSNPQIRCVAANILWQPSSMPCPGIFSTM